MLLEPKAIRALKRPFFVWVVVAWGVSSSAFGALEPFPYFEHNGALGARLGVASRTALVGLDLRYAYRPRLFDGMVGGGLEVGGLFGTAASVYGGLGLTSHPPGVPLSVGVALGVASRTGASGLWFQARTGYAFDIRELSLSPEISFQYSAGQIGFYVGASLGFGFRNLAQ